MENLTINGRYRILQQIGVGGFGLTYLAEDLQLQTRPRCVVKHLRPQIADAETLELANRLFQQEAEILYRLGGHPQIPSLIAHFKERGEFYLVQEFIEGHTLDREFTGGRIYNQKEIIRLLGQTLEILSFVHKQNVIHRDIKPANLIRRTADGSIFLIDFGAVKQVSAAAPRTPQSATFSTVTIGSHGYMPMEQMAGNPNFSSDLYALGLIVIEALTGTKPLDLHKNPHSNEFIWKQRAQLSPEVEHFISKLVRHDFRQRFHSANEALAALNAIAANTGFFNNRMQSGGVTMLQPIVNNQNLPPKSLPVSNPQFIPPTIIVPTQNFAAGNLPRGLSTTAEPRTGGSTGKWMFWGIFGICCFIGFLFVAGKILNFRRTSLELADKNPRQSSRQNEVGTLNSSSTTIYDEAEKQVEEARTMEKTATTKFEWEEISNKYKRAYNLLVSIDSSNPNYEKAQIKITEYKQKAEFAEDRAMNSPNSPVTSSNPQSVGMLETPSPDGSDKPNRAKLTMPPKQSVQHYLAFNSDDGYAVRSQTITSENALFTSKFENYSYNEKDSKVVVIDANGTRVKFKPPLYTPKLKAGNYSAVLELSSQPTMNYSISFSQFYCSQNANHSFTINGIVYDDLYQNVSYLDATFSLSCGERKLLGRVHYDAR